MNFDLAEAASAPATAESTAAAAQHRRLTNAAQQFEGMLLQELLKPMKEHGFSQQEDDHDDGAGGDTLSSYGTEAMATAIAKGGGLGIARQVVEQVEGERSSHRGRASGAELPSFQNNFVASTKVQAFGADQRG